jgi:hypothetical protein
VLKQQAVLAVKIHTPGKNSAGSNLSLCSSQGAPTLRSVLQTRPSQIKKKWYFQAAAQAILPTYTLMARIFNEIFIS